MDDAPFDVQSLILPDVLTVSQFVDRNKPRDRSAHRTLAAAILDLTIHDLNLYRYVKRRPGRPSSGTNEGLIARKTQNYKDALAWLKDSRSDGLFSFNSCCELLSIDADLLRGRLLELLDGKEAA